jgi:serine phosphatase RsbU (regulator of sigma subunit)/anti-sigma regulatory factor (Ser/Thr protein kinase)/GAF domain-containing protein
VSRMTDQVSELQAAQDQIEQLVQAIVEIGSDLDLHGTLHRIVKAAIELTGARLGALAVSAVDGGPSSFIHAGVDAGVTQQFADLMVGQGLRIDDLAAHPSAVSPDAGATRIRAVLAIPIRVRAADFGYLYLADDRLGHVFSDSQERAVRALVSAAAVAIDNARLFEQERETAKWTRASREITTALLSGDPQTAPLQLIVNRALELAEAEQAILLVPTESDVPDADTETLIVAATAGRYSTEVIGQRIPMDRSTTGSVARRGIPLITDSFQYPIEGFTDAGERSAIVIPLIADETALGVIAVARNPQQQPFGTDYLDLVSDFARHAALALALAAGREHALNRQLAQADTVDDAVVVAAEELRRLWRARRVLTVAFSDSRQGAETSSDGINLISVGDAAQWAELPSHLQRRLCLLRDGDQLRPYASEPGTAGIALQHPDGVLVVWIELAEQRPFTLEDQTLLTMQAGRLGQALHRVHQVDQQRETALALQHAILGPAYLPPGFAVRYQAASRPLQVGGDWYDVVDLDDGRIGLVVGDCVGHGLAAATVMGQLRSACRALLLERPSPRIALAGLDRFAARLPGARCTTAVCAVLNSETGELVYSSAGHPPAIVMHADGTTRIIEDGRTIPVGVRPDRGRPEARLTLPARAVLLLYTDGLVERRHTGLDDGIAEVCALLHESRDAELEHLASQIMQRLAPSDGYQDDVALLLYRHPAPLQIDFPADVNRLADVRNALRDWLVRAEVDANQIHDVLIAAGEAVSNSIEHGHRESPEGVIRLRATVGADVVRVAIVDSGTWKPPRPAAQRHRGRGIQLMQGLMQDVTIDRENDGTTVHLTARIV